MWSTSSQCGAGGDNEFIPPFSGNDLTKRLCRLPYTYKGKGGTLTGRFFRGSPWEAVRLSRVENRGDAEAQRVICPPGRAPTRGPTPHRSTPAPTRSTTECILPTKYLPLKAGEVPCIPFSSHLRCFCTRHYMPGEVLISASPRNSSITVLSCCVTSFQEGQRIVAVRMKVAVARMSCDDAPTRTSNSPASATQLWVESS